MDDLDGNYGLQLEPSFSSSTALCLGEGFVSSFDGYIPDLNPATPLARIAIRILCCPSMTFINQDLGHVR